MTDNSNLSFRDRIQQIKLNQVANAAILSPKKSGDSSLSFRDRIRINQTGKLVAQPVRTVEKEIMQVSAGTIANALNENLKNAMRTDIEKSPRETLLKMLINSKLDELFIFKTIKGGGEDFLQAIRQVLSRARKKAIAKRQTLDDFKLKLVGVKREEGYDEVTVLRTKTLSDHEESVYDELIAAFAVKKEEKE